MSGRQGIAEEFLRRSVTDDQLRAQLTPDYPFRCKRVLLGGDYYAALQQDNVSLVAEPIEKVTEDAVCTASSTTEADVIVLATGFQTNRYLAGIEVTGVGDSHYTTVGARIPAPTSVPRSAASRIS